MPRHAASTAAVHAGAACLVVLATVRGLAQPPDGGRDFFGPPGGLDLKLVERFDADASGRLDAAERAKAREAAKAERSGRHGGRGGFGRDRDGRPSPQPGRRVERSEGLAHPGVDLYDTAILRTVFLDFPNADWEQELADFYGTDVEVPATITVDQATIEGVGVHFRGASSFFGVGEGFKRSLNIAVDHTDAGANVLGYRTLNLLNAHGDPSLMSTVLYSHIAGSRIPTPRANFVRLVINGENWGVYTNVEQANKDFLKRCYGDTKGDRWKVKGRPGGRGGLEYFGDDVERYHSTYEIKTKDTPEAWRGLIDVCRRLAETPPERIETDLGPVLDLEGILWFLALDNALVNSDGYWARASDYTLFADAKGMFHLIPHDMNEAFSSGHGGPGGRRGGRPPPPVPASGNDPRPGPAPPPDGSRPPRPFGPGGSPTLDPLVGLDDLAKPLRGRLLADAVLRDRYLAHVQAIARDQLDWPTLGPTIARWRALIIDAVREDTRKLSSTEAFEEMTSPEPPKDGRTNLRGFLDKRRGYLLDYTPNRPATDRPTAP